LSEAIGHWHRATSCLSPYRSRPLPCIHSSGRREHNSYGHCYYSGTPLLRGTVPHTSGGMRPSDSISSVFCKTLSQFGCYLTLVVSRDSSVGIAVRYGLDDRGSRVRFPAGAGNFSLNHRVQNGSGAHLASYPFPGGKAAGA
jgi:hypothetical protein